MDADLYPDILSVADFSNTRVFMSNGENAGVVSFRDATDNGVIIDRNGMGAAVGDVDNDGDLDWFVTGIFGSNETVGNRLYLNDGSGALVDATVGAGVEDGGWGWGACFADFNLDGRLDIFHTNGWESNPIDDFENDRSRLFIAGAAGLELHRRGRGPRHDGHRAGARRRLRGLRRGRRHRHLHDEPRPREFRRVLGERRPESDNQSLSVRLVGSAPNTEGVGARIRVTLGGVVQMREVAVGNNFTSQNPAAQVFGLGGASSADSVEIEWPDGSVDNYADVDAGTAVFHQ